MIGLALEGGGVRGAYQAGAYMAFLECGIKIDGVCGTSIGALNGIIIASNKGELLPRIWRNSNMASIFVFSLEYVEAVNSKKVNLKNLKSIFLDLVKILINKGIELNGLKELIDKEVDIDELLKSDIDFGLVTVRLKDLKPVCLFKEEMNKDKIKDYCVTMSSKGLRLLGFAMKNINTLPKEGDMIEEDLTFIGIMGIIDPPREEVKHAISTCHEAGIKVIMITGDHKLTATSIAKDLGIYKKGDLVVDGEELSKMSDLKLRNTIKNISVFARVTPKDKLRIVNALKKNKEIVAMTGDGVNDAPALKTADIGVAMGITGTDVAKDSAAMILLDDNFTTIEEAVKEGRRVYRNIQKVIQYLLAGNIAEVLTIFVTMLFNLDSPLLAVHILFINLVTDTLPSLALGIDPASPNIMKHKPVKQGSLFEKGLVFRIGFYGIYLAIITLVAYFIGSKDGFNVGMTMAFTVLCLSQIFHALNQSSSETSLFSKDYPRNKMLYLAMLGSVFFLLIVLFITPIREFFSLSVLTGNEWLVVILLSLSPILVVEIFKLIRRNLKMES